MMSAKRKLAAAAVVARRPSPSVPRTPGLLAMLPPRRKNAGGHSSQPDYPVEIARAPCRPSRLGKTRPPDRSPARSPCSRESRIPGCVRRCAHTRQQSVPVHARRNFFQVAFEVGRSVAARRKENVVDEDFSARCQRFPDSGQQGGFFGVAIVMQGKAPERPRGSSTLPSHAGMRSGRRGVEMLVQAGASRAFPGQSRVVCALRSHPVIRIEAQAGKVA